jgi:outer membrane protein assembly factor BamD
MCLLIFSCTTFRKVQKKGTWKEKYEAAVKYYEEEDYNKAIILLEDILPVLRGTEYAEKAEFIYAYSYFRQGQLVLSSHYFQNFYRTYSRSTYAEEAMYMYAYSLYSDSPVSTLDQTSTIEAINAMQLFLNRHPTSKFREPANDIIDELQEKLEKKSYDNAKQYYQLRRYKAAVVAFENFKRDFPDSDYVEEVTYLSIDAQYRLADLSIQSKKKERYQEAIQLYEDYIDTYPQGAFVRDAEKIYANSRDRLDKLMKLEKLTENNNY